MYVVVSYGMGADSTALLVEWLERPASRPRELLPDLSNLIVITAQPGQEWVETAMLVEQHIYPLLAKHRVRMVQVARAGPYERDGIVVLDDTREPILCLTTGGTYTLPGEMTSNATVPQSGGRRTHSIKFKGWAIDQWMTQTIGDEPYIHVLGYEANELERVLRDGPLGLPNRIPIYPLVTWGWDRDDCEWFLWDHFKVWWPKSACVACPFSFSLGSRAESIRRFQRNPHQGVEALVMEYLAVAVNPLQGLLAGKQLYHLLASTPGSGPLLALFEQQLNDMPWAVYDVRRAYAARGGDHTKRGTTRRSLARLAVGSRAETVARLERAAHLRGCRLDIGSDGRFRRVWWRHRELFYPTAQHLLTAGPDLADDKTLPAFAEAWRAGLRGAPQLSLAI
ncbi:hypothetical protein FXF51_01550 [Nonomuraea sp. PA05]|uniref:hypothetical protein n=1 Tax=Nonomuraea sp. PA05 TaxID=2604466 RepID=UPI0011D8BEF4|nr:hypothetical protein [Nonomuraea sp. PA05]TYB71146.1 hypothetical protein FXF51_01550 [Nonomuraea sp. PA05]